MLGGVASCSPSVTTVVAVEFALADPAVFEALTTTRRVAPMSLSVGAYVLLLAPVMSWHSPPDSLQRCHWSLWLMGAVPDQEPCVALSVWPVFAWPEITGAEVLDGATGVSALWISASTVAVV